MQAPAVDSVMVHSFGQARACFPAVTLALTRFPKALVLALQRGRNRHAAVARVGFQLASRRGFGLLPLVVGACRRRHLFAAFALQEFANLRSEFTKPALRAGEAS